MPELPEVETVRQVLRTKILNKQISDIKVLYKDIIKDDPVEVFINRLKGQTINEIQRKGKYLFFVLDDCYLISHLRMEGKYFLKDPKDKVDTHEHILINLGDIELRYHDVRKFGTMQIRNKEDLYTTNPILKLGMEPLTEDFTYEKLLKIIKTKKKLKTFLLDQTFICGIGNIYADEICFGAKLHPEEILTNLTDEDIFNIYTSTNEVIAKAVADGGTTIRSYTSSLGVTGRFQLRLNVHQREKEKCKTCGHIIIKTKVSGRGTYTCPNCQKLK
ncbi:MAG: DNA-formamidopyrimidine glycosylase [bacterium]